MSKDDGLSHLIEEGIIEAVHSRLMSGKEATVYVVERNGHLAAAKVYRARDDRTFKKVSSYVEGRNQTRNSRDRRAMGKKSAYGRELLEEGWQDTEFQALRGAFEAGVRVPEPYFLHDNVLFMELVLDAGGAPAPRLADLVFTPQEATSLHLEVFLQVRRLLETGRVHADLSAYNILMAANGPTLIDLPQVVDVARNANAGQILRRDLRNVTEHLSRFDARLLRFADCGAALFTHCVHGTLELATGPEERAPQSRRGGRRGRDAERGRAGREKSQHPPESRVRPPAQPTSGPRDGRTESRVRPPAQPTSGPRDGRTLSGSRPRDDRRPARRR
jgi:RIO kinase 1